MQIKRQSKLKTLNSYNYKLGILETLGWCLLIIYMVPFYLMLINSFKSRREIFDNTTGSVSYTHLTLPTIYSV